MANTEGWLSGQGLRETLGEAADKMKQTAGEAGKWGKDFVNGLRGQTPQIATPAGGGEGYGGGGGGDGSGTQVARMAPQPTGGTMYVNAAGEMAGTTPAQEAGLRAARPQAQAAPRAAPGVSAEQAAWQAERAAQDAASAKSGMRPASAPRGAPPVEPPAGRVAGLRAAGGGMLKTGLKGLGTGAVIAGAYDALQNGTTLGDAQISDSFAGGNAANQKVLGISPETSNAIRGSIVNTGRRVLNAFDPRQLLGQEGRLGNQIVGGAFDMSQGNQVGTTQFVNQTQPQPAAPIAQQPVQAGNVPPPDVPQGPTSAGGPGGGYVQNNQTGLRQGVRNTQVFDGLGAMPANATPEQAREWLQKANSINAARNVAPQVGTGGSRGDALRPLRDLVALDKGAPGASGFGAMAALGGYGALSRMKEKTAEIGQKRETAALVADTARERTRAEAASREREFRRAVRSDNEKAMGTEFEELARAQLGPAPTGKNDVPGFEAAVKANASKIAERARYSTADTGRDPRDLNTQERQQLYQAMRIQDKVEGARAGLMQKAADYFGDKRFDSKNAYSYMPEKVEKATRPGESWVVHMKNGNRIALSEIGNGKFNLLGPNEPVDADMMALIQPLIDKAKKAK